MKYFVTVCRDNGAGHRTQTMGRTVGLKEAENLVTVAILAGKGTFDAAFLAAEMRGSMLRKSQTAWGWQDELKVLTVRVEKVNS